MLLKMNDEERHDAFLWMEVCQYLSPDDLCRVERLSRWHRVLVAGIWERLDETDVATNDGRQTIQYRSRNGKSAAWTAKERVCRFWLARRCADRYRCQRGSTAGAATEEQREQHRQGDLHPSCWGCCDYPSFQSDNLLGPLEYFITIACTRKRRDCDDEEEQEGEILWNGFCPATCWSIRLDHVDHAPFLCRANEWRELMDFLDSHQGQHQHPTNLSIANYPEPLLSRTRRVIQRCSVLVLGMELHPCSLGAEHSAMRVHRIMDARPGSGHLFLHVDDSACRRHDPGFSRQVLEASARQQRERRRQGDGDAGGRPLLHLWVRTTPTQPARLLEMRIDKCAASTSIDDGST